MQHRHLKPHVIYEPVAVEDILERGKPQDWVRLRDAVLAEPDGPIAQTVLDVCNQTYMYGTSTLWKMLVLSARHEQRGRRS